MASHNPYGFRCLPPAGILPFVSLTVNSKFVIQCSESGSYCLNNEGPRLHVLITAPNMPSAQILRVVVTVGDKQKDIELKSRLEAKSVFLFSMGTTLDVTVCSQTKQTPVTSAEAALVRTIETTLDDTTINPRQGSMPSSALKALVRKESGNRYDTVIAKHGSWAGFLTSHADSFTTFRYSETELRSRKLLGQISPNELRVVRKNDPKAKKNVAHVSEKCVAEDLCLALRHETEAFALLGRCNSETLKVSCASFSLMMRFLQKHKDKFRWTTDPTQKTVIGLL